MKTRIFALTPLVIALFGCGADENTNNQNEGMLTLNELEAALPISAQSTNSNGLTGLWLMQFTSQLAVDNATENDETEQLHYLHGRQVTLITETEDGFTTSFCGSSAFHGDINFSKTTEAEESTYSAGVVSDTTHFNLNISDNLEMEGDLMIPLENNVVGTYHLLGLKLSDSTTFAGASNELDIDASLTLDGEQYEFSELGQTLTCIGDSTGTATGFPSDTQTPASYSGLSTTGGATIAVSFALDELECPLGTDDSGDDVTAIACDGISTSEIQGTPFDDEDTILNTGFRVLPSGSPEQILEFSATISAPEA